MKHGHGYGHKGTFSLDYYAYASRIRDWNPNYKAFLAITALIFCAAADNIFVSCTVAVTMGALTVGRGGLGFLKYLELMAVPLAFMMLSSIAIAVDFSQSAFGQYRLQLYWFYLYTSDENIFRTLHVMMKAFGAVSAMYMLVLSTPASEIISVLRRMHVPKLVIELMNMIYRFIFILMDVQCNMKHSAVARLGYCDFKTACYSFGSTAGNLLLVSMKKAGAYYDALVSRCYEGELLFLEENKPVKAIHKVLAAAYLALLVIIWQFTK